MKVLLCHNRYQQPGGEDRVFDLEASLLEQYGHRVLRYSVHNDRISEMTSLVLAKDTLWSSTSYRELLAIIRRERPQVVHLHNTFPLISPSGYYAARAEGVPVVQTLHNYRLICPSALCFRDGDTCEECVGKTLPWPAVVHACYRESRRATGVVATLLTVHHALRTWTRMVNVYIALTTFQKQKLIQGGLPAEKIMVKPNFIRHESGPSEGDGKYALFVGRLSIEKGIHTLLAAWERLGKQIPLKIAGHGPLANEVAIASKKFEGLEWLGRISAEQVSALMREARILIFPSICYEAFGLTIVEAYAAGLPVIGSKLGSTLELIDHGRTGLHFRPGDPDDLAAKVKWAFTHPSELSLMRSQARAEFEAKYTARQNYKMLSDIYAAAMARSEVHA